MDRDAVVSSVVRGTVALVGQAVLSRLLALFATVFVARLVGPKEMAVWSVLSSLTSLGWGLTDLGVGAALIRGESEPSPLAFRQAAGLQLVALVSLLVLGALFWLGGSASIGWAPELPALVMIVALGMVIRIMGTPARAILERNMRFSSLAICDSVASVVQSLLLVGSLWLGAGVSAFAISAVAGNLSGILVLRVLFREPMPKPALGLEAIRPYLRFGLAFQVNELAGLAREAITPLLLVATLGPVVAGLWAWVRKILELVYMWLNIGWRVTFPAYARLGSKTEWSKMAYRVLVVTYWPLLLISVGLMVAGRGVLSAIFGSQW